MIIGKAWGFGFEGEIGLSAVMVLRTCLLRYDKILKMTACKVHDVQQWMPSTILWNMKKEWNVFLCLWALWSKLIMCWSRDRPITLTRSLLSSSLSSVFLQYFFINLSTTNITTVGDTGQRWEVIFFNHIKKSPLSFYQTVKWRRWWNQGWYWWGAR